MEALAVAACSLPEQLLPLRAYRGSLGSSATSAQAQAAKPPVNAAPPQASVLPYPDPEFKGVIGRTTEELQAGLSAADFGA